MPAIADRYGGHPRSGHADSLHLPTAGDRAHSLRRAVLLATAALQPADAGWHAFSIGA